jgi:hypothetical protein
VRPLRTQSLESLESERCSAKCDRCCPLTAATSSSSPSPSPRCWGGGRGRGEARWWSSWKGRLRPCAAVQTGSGAGERCSAKCDRCCPLTAATSSSSPSPSPRDPPRRLPGRGVDAGLAAGGLGVRVRVDVGEGEGAEVRPAGGGRRPRRRWTVCPRRVRVRQRTLFRSEPDQGL